jgi:hypothetical protein
MRMHRSRPKPLRQPQALIDATIGFGLRTGGDDAAAIQNAVDQASTQGGAAVYLGSGPLTFKSGISWQTPGIQLIGNGPGSTVATIAYSPTTDVIAIGASGGNAGFSSVQKMEFVMGPGFTQSNGALIHVTNSHDVTFSEIASWDSDAGHCFRAHYYINGGPNQYITWLRDLEINPLNPTAGDAAIVIGGSGLGGSDGGGIPQDMWIENVEIGGGNVADCGMVLYNSAGTQIIGCDIISSVMSVATFPGVGQQVVNTFCDALLCGGSRDRGCLLGSGGGIVASFHCVNSWFSSTGINWGSRPGEVSGLVINGGSGSIIDTLSFTSCHFLTNWYDGVETLGNAANIDFIGCQFSGNGFGSPGNYNGLLAYGNAGIGGLSIIGGANGSLWQSWPTVQGSGLNIGNGISPLTIQGVQTIGNLTGGIVSDSPY